jgi:hypothetical protein
MCCGKAQGNASHNTWEEPGLKKPGYRLKEIIGLGSEKVPSCCCLKEPNVPTLDGRGDSRCIWKIGGMMIL